ncbi:MAG: glutamate--tRNA ligase [Gemmatimonas sp.]
MPEVRTRFAPSPTGELHLGNARVALVNWLFARAHGGAFLLRMDDTDRERSRSEYAAKIEEDLRWLGLDWDAFARQSDRIAHYTAALDRLKASGRVYACYDTPEELERMRARARLRKLPPVYDRSALKLDDVARAKLEAKFSEEGRKPHWRFKLTGDTVAWTDAVHGPVSIATGTISDPVVMREDGTFLYVLTSPVDDAELGVSHVIRGDDHLTNTAAQIEIIEALGHSAPTFAHLPLLLAADGGPLSKREGAASLSELRERGIEPMAIDSMLATLGRSGAVHVAGSLAELARGFDLGTFGKASPRLDERELDALNARVLHAMPFAEAQPRLARIGLGDADERFWLAVRGNIERIADAKTWWDVVEGPIPATIEDPDLCAVARDLLPPEPWTEATWPAWTGAVRERTGRSGKALFHPLRLALTGREHGPEMKNLLPLIGRERALKRLSGATA